MVYAPDTTADEATIRAREAIIATGVFAGSEEIIRAGLLDHTHGIQSAIEYQRTAHLPLNELALQPHRAAPKLAERLVVDVSPPPRNYFWIGWHIGNWISKLHHRLVRHWVYYDRMKAAHDERMSALITELKSETGKRQTAEAFADHWHDRVEELREQVRRLERAKKTHALATEQKASLSFLDMLTACNTEDERAALAKLAKEAIFARRVGKEHNEVTLSVRLPASPIRKSASCKMCGKSTDRTTCEPCLTSYKADIDKRMNRAKRGDGHIGFTEL